ncbi:MAG: hypothetical protein QXE96_03825 [Candidatus Caldarchaeum sp.]
MDIRGAAAATVIAAFAYITVFHYPLVRGLELTNLLFYMDVWPTFIAAVGYSTAYLLSSRLSINLGKHWSRYIGFSTAAALIFYWHLPANSFFGYGICPADLNNPILYQLKRISYFITGIILYFSAQGLSKPWREALAIAFGKVMGWYGFYLTLVTEPLYVAPPVIFSPQLHHEAGAAMILSMIALDFLAAASLINHLFKDKKATPYPIITRTEN